MTSMLFNQLENGNSRIQLTHSWFVLAEFESFARELRDIETVEIVFLRANQINDEMVEALADALKYNKSIKEL
jgi:hypothetical protein